MKDKKYYIDLLEHRIINYNEYWEDPMGHTELRDNTEETVKLLKAYFNVIQTLEKQYDKNCWDKEDYTKYPENVKSTIRGIIDLINDGRDLRTPKVYKNRKVSDLTCIDKGEDRLYNRADKNGYLAFENNPWDEVNWCYDFLNKLEEIIQSEKSTVDFAKYYNGKWYLFQGYESGSVSVRFTKINKNKDGIYTFDGDLINWATIDSHYDGDGVIINSECEDIQFTELPYCRDNFESDEELIKFIESCEEVETDEEIKKEVHRVMDDYLDDLLGI